MGVIIKDPSEVQLAFNVIKQNTIQVEMDKKAAKKQWAAIQKDNPKISGQNSIPKSTCNIFWQLKR